MYGIKVHIWLPVFVENGMWVSVEDSNETVNQNFINKRLDEVSELAKIRGISGIQLDYLRFSGNADDYPDPTKSLNNFAHDAHDRIKAINHSLELSITIMPETYFILLKNHNEYGQDYSELSSVADKVVIMMYKGNYNEDANWIKDRTDCFVHNSKGAQVIIGLQTYESEYNATRLSSDELTNDANAAIEGGSQGIAFFRYGLTNLVDLKNLY